MILIDSCAANDRRRPPGRLRHDGQFGMIRGRRFLPLAEVQQGLENSCFPGVCAVSETSARIQDHFGELSDPHRRKVTYPLMDMVVIALCAVICGADDFAGGVRAVPVELGHGLAPDQRRSGDRH